MTETARQARIRTMLNRVDAPAEDVVRELASSTGITLEAAAVAWDVAGGGQGDRVVPELDALERYAAQAGVTPATLREALSPAD